MKIGLPLLFISCLSLFACKEKQKSASGEQKTVARDTTRPAKDSIIHVLDSSETYFSVRDYLNDQWSRRNGEPYTLLKIQNINGKKDSSYVKQDSTLWYQMSTPFLVSDISAKSLLGQYRYSEFEDETTDTKHAFYEAISNNTYTQKLDISIDPSSRLIKGLYIETRGLDKGKLVSRKLHYVPDHIFQIQEFSNENGNKRDIQLEYRYNY